jgi:hypothetical protein
MSALRLSGFISPIPCGDNAHFGIVKQLEDAIARIASRESRNAPLESEKNGAPNEVAASHRQSAGPRTDERADLEAGAAGRTAGAGKAATRRRTAARG